MSYAVFVHFEIKHDHLERFLTLMRQQAANSLKIEPECHKFEVWRGSDTSNKVHLYEVYEDASAFQNHLASDHFKAFDRAVADMILDKTVITADLQESA